MHGRNERGNKAEKGFMEPSNQRTRLMVVLALCFPIPIHILQCYSIVGKQMLPKMNNKVLTEITTQFYIQFCLEIEQF